MASSRCLLLLLALVGAAVESIASHATVLNPTVDESEGHPAYVHPKHKHWRARSLLYKIDENAKVTADSYVFEKNPSTYTVSWEGVTNPDGKDLIGVWSPGEADPSTIAPVMWYSANVSDYLTTGSGSWNFTFYNLRNNYRFRLVSGNAFPNPTVIAESALVMNKIPNYPHQVHLSIANDTKSIVVQWVTNSSEPMQVTYSLNKGMASSHTGKGDGKGKGPIGTRTEGPKDKVWTSMSTTSKYTKDMFCGAPATGQAFTDPGYTHTAILDASNIGNNKRVYYVVGDTDNGMTEEMSFKSPPEVGSKDPLRFVVFNDVGSIAETLFNNTCICTNYTAGTNVTGFRSCRNNTDGSIECCEGYCPIPPGTPAGQQWYLTMFQYTPNSVKLPPVLVSEESEAHLAILNGDLSYAQGYTDSWDIFGHQMEPATSMWPMVTGSGNHEREYPGSGDIYNKLLDEIVDDSGGECNVAYTYRYYNPGPGDVLDYDKSYHSFEMGPVLFLILDTEVASDPESPQGKWVKGVLSKISKKTPWVVVSTHRMIVQPSVDTRPVQGDIETSKRLLDDYEELFKGKVHFVVSGHMHAYSRTCPLYKYNCTAPASSSFIRNPKSPIYITTGNAGAGFTHSFPKVLPDYVAFGAQDINGYVRFEADQSTISMQAISTDPLMWSQGTRSYSFDAGAVFDTVTLTK